MGETGSPQIAILKGGTDTAALLEDLRDLYDFILQFAGSESGNRFLQAWKKARIIVDASHGPGEEEEPPASPPTPPAP